MARWSRTVLQLVRIGVVQDCKNIERLLTPMFLGCTVLLLFAFTMGEPAPDVRGRMFAAETLLTILFGLQLSYSRAFELERQDRLFDVLRTSLQDPGTLVAAKLLHVTFNAIVICLPLLLLSLLLQSQDAASVVSLPVLAILILSIVGLGTLGVLLSLITLKAQSSQILFPILYFPLATPVVLSATESLVLWMNEHAAGENFRSWLIMLLVFDVIYLTLTWMLGGDLVKQTAE